MRWPRGNPRASRRHAALAALLCAVALAPAASGAVGAAGNRCTALASADLSLVQDAPTQIERSEEVAGAQGDAPYCIVFGHVAPQVGFEVRLPLAHWNGKLIAVGNGGWGGTINGRDCDAHIRQGYACVASDTGHSGTSDDGRWAADNLPAQADFGYRSVHVATLAAKAIIARYYAQQPSRSYFVGCSTGGYQGLVEAQHFPWDFDGIVAGAPDMDEADTTARELWSSRNFLDEHRHPVLDDAAIQLLHRAVLAACDASDGLRDGILANPLACRFDPAELVCRRGAAGQCLTQAQVDAVRRIYAGPPQPRGRPRVRGVLPGSELNWGDPADGLAGVGATQARGLFPNMLYGASHDLTPETYDFERDYKRLGMGRLYADRNPDLREFQATGGKLIVYQGWSDIVEMPTSIVDYYETVERTLGGREATRQFFRLFMIPGMNHCSGGDGAYAIDYLGYLEAWVERHEAPERLIGGHLSERFLAALPADAELPPLHLTGEKKADARLPVRFTRPIYPYPSYARYRGHGDPDEAASFEPVSD